MTHQKADNSSCVEVREPGRVTSQSESLRSSSPTASTCGTTENGGTLPRLCLSIGRDSANVTAKMRLRKRSEKYPKRTLWYSTTLEANQTSSSRSKVSAGLDECLGHANTSGLWSTRTSASRNGRTSSTLVLLTGSKRCTT